MSPWKSLLLAASVVGGEIAGLAVSASKNPAGWAYAGLSCLILAYVVACGIGWLYGRYKITGTTRWSALVMLVLGYPVFWLYCLIWVTTASWGWATFAAIGGIFLEINLVIAGIKGAIANLKVAVEAAPRVE